MTDDVRELDDAVHQQITYLSERGNALMEDGAPARAVEMFERALDLVPEPKTDWEAATWLNASVGDALFAQRQFAAARDRFLDALNCPGGPTNPFIQLRLGECCHELGDLPRARQHLMRAYMLAGLEIFASEPRKYYDLIRNDVAAR
jgi:tetratricopeptide (TPR) repeat protein